MLLASPKIENYVSIIVINNLIHIFKKVTDTGYNIYKSVILKVLKTKRTSCKYKIFENPIITWKKY